MPVDYSNQNITNTNLTGVDLSGGDFTNTNATNVNFTNANITNATFKNTLITGANISTLTFSNLQKGQLLLREANIGISAINNLTSLTLSQLRTIQPAIPTRTVINIQTVTVKIPNSQSEGYNVSITPVINQIVCIFVAVNQNIVIYTSGSSVRTIRSNGTVIQDVDNANATITHLKVGTVSYRLSIGNGDGVIAMIPLDINAYKVNESGIGDIIALNTSSSSANSYSMYWGDGTARSAKVTFTLPTAIDLRSNKARVSLKVRSNLSYLNYPILVFNDNHTYPSYNNYVTEMSSSTNLWNGGGANYFTWPNNTPTQVLWNDGSMTFNATVHPTAASDPYWLLNFWVELVYDNATGSYKQMIAKGDWVLIDKTVGGNTNVYLWNGTFTRISELAGPTYILNKIGFGSYNNGGNFSNALRGVTINVEVVPTTFNSGGTTTL